jgi:hypothetical protein
MDCLLMRDFAFTSRLIRFEEKGEEVMRLKNLLSLCVVLVLGVMPSRAFAYSSAYFFGIYQNADGNGNSSITEPNWVAAGDVLVYSAGHFQPAPNVRLSGFVKLRTTTVAGATMDTFCRVATPADAFMGNSGGHQFTMSGYAPNDQIFGQIINITRASVIGDFNAITSLSAYDQSMPALGFGPINCNPDFVGDNSGANVTSLNIDTSGVQPHDVVYMIGTEMNAPHNLTSQVAFNVPIYDNIISCDAGGCNGTAGSSGNPYENFNFNAGSATPSTVTASSPDQGPFLLQVISFPSSGAPTASPTPYPTSSSTPAPTASPSPVATPFPSTSATFGFNPNPGQACTLQVHCN